MSGQLVPLQQWSSFFSITPAASATLLGLLFVVITIAPGLGRKLASKSRIYLTPAVIYLTSVLVMSALLTIPNQTQLSSVICICTMGIFGLVYTGSLTVVRSEFYEKRSDRYRYRCAVPGVLGIVHWRPAVTPERPSRSGRGGGRNGYVTERRNPKLVVNGDFDPIVAELRTLLRRSRASANSTLPRCRGGGSDRRQSNSGLHAGEQKEGLAIRYASSRQANAQSVSPGKP